MEAREIYHVLKAIVEPIHAHNDQMVAISKWIEAEFEHKRKKQRELLVAYAKFANGDDKLYACDEASIDEFLNNQRHEGKV